MKKKPMDLMSNFIRNDQGRVMNELYESVQKEAEFFRNVLLPMVKRNQPETMTIIGTDQNGKEVVETGVKICSESGRKEGE